MISDMMPMPVCGGGMDEWPPGTERVRTRSNEPFSDTPGRAYMMWSPKDERPVPPSSRINSTASFPYLSSMNGARDPAPRNPCDSSSNPNEKRIVRSGWKSCSSRSSSTESSAIRTFLQSLAPRPQRKSSVAL